MNAGDLAHRVWADEPVAAQNEIGEEIITWTPRQQLWCSIAPSGGQQAIKAGERVAYIDTVITVRWSAFAARITPKWRLRFVRSGLSITYTIVKPGAENLMRMQYIEFGCIAFAPELTTLAVPAVGGSSYADGYADGYA